MTVLEGVDYSEGRPSPAALAAAGYQFAIRYLAYGGINRKFLTKPEADALLASGVAIGLVFEVDEGRTLKGFSQGVIDGALALTSANDLGAPENVAIFVAVDTDVDGNLWGSVAAYFAGLVRGGIPLARLGAYGPGALVRWLQTNGYVSLTWQAMAWNYDRTDDETFDLWQYDQGSVDGASVDFNRAYTNHWLWKPVEHIDQEDDMAGLEELNAAIVKRADLTRVANGTDEKGYANMLKLWEYAKAQGMLG